jgi:hypothetical protein
MDASLPASGRGYTAGSPRYTRRHRSAKVVVLQLPLRVRRARHEGYDVWVGFGKAAVSGALG